MKLFGIVFIVLAVIAILVGLNSYYTVRQDKQALVLEFGNPILVRNQFGETPDGQLTDEAGLFLKMPWQEVVMMDRRNIGTDIADIEVLASDQRRLTVDAFVRWRITDPLKFYQRLRNEFGAERQIQRFTESAIRDALGKVPVPEIVSGQRAQLMAQIRTGVNEGLQGTGLAIIDVRIRQADLPVNVAEGVYERMRTERQQVAQGIRSEGNERALLIRATADREATIIRAEANESSQTIRGEGDAKANQVYASAYSKDPSFFRFQRALIACETAIQTGTEIVVGPQNLDLCDVFIDQAQAAGARR